MRIACRHLGGERVHVRSIRPAAGCGAAVWHVVQPVWMPRLHCACSSPFCRSLGANDFQVFWNVTLPNIRWGLLYGIILTNAVSP